MCDTCPTHILGPGEVAGKVARSKAGRKVASVLFYGIVWTIGVPLLPFAVWGIFGWWVIPLGVLAAAAFAAGALLVRQLHRQHMLIVAPPSLQQRVAQPALPRAMRRSLTRPQRALPAPAKAIEGVVVAPLAAVPVARGKMRP